MVFINGVDKENSSYVETLNALSEKYKGKIVPIILPVLSDKKMTGFVNVLEGKTYMLDNDKTAVDVPADMKAQCDEIKAQLSESAAESDEELLEKFFSGGELTTEEIAKGLKKSIVAGSAIPVIAGAAAQNKGIVHLMNQIVSLLPSPLDRGSVKAQDLKGGEVTLNCDPSAPAVLYVFKTIADKFIGRLSLFKVISGTVKVGSSLLNTTKDITEKISSLNFLRGKEKTDIDSVTAGDIGAIAKLEVTGSGDTLCDASKPVKLPAIDLPSTVLTMAVYSAKKGDEDKVFSGLYRLQDEDTSFTVTKNAETNEMLVNGVGETQLAVLCSKLKSKFGVEAVLKEPRIAFRETVKKRAEAEGKHKKQSGGAGQFGVASIRFEPGAADGQFEFVDAVVGGAVPRQFIPAVEKGLRDAVKEGMLAGYPMVDLKATLFDGKSHPVDSKEIAFVSAAKLAYEEAIPKAGPILLEPVYLLRITVPDTYMGDILGDMSKRRGRVLGTESVNGKQIISAEAPLSEVMKYSIDLRSMTQGRGFYEMEFVRYEEVPGANVPKIVADTKKWEEEKNQK
jgi:elongation factor G